MKIGKRAMICFITIKHLQLIGIYFIPWTIVVQSNNNRDDYNTQWKP